ncbi:MAG: hypothetical protein SPH68_03515 [Candidatus Borkfalkiaceae bacterium]|nr:hypothetical protein [Clostridia bacterium]MDY6223214.1 hypothetical protein [Christensenellaceae bacterium]
MRKQHNDTETNKNAKNGSNSKNCSNCGGRREKHSTREENE